MAPGSVGLPDSKLHHRAACGRLCITKGAAIRALVGLVLFYAFCAPVTWLQRLA